MIRLVMMYYETNISHFYGYYSCGISLASYITPTWLCPCNPVKSIPSTGDTMYHYLMYIKQLYHHLTHHNMYI